jgi:Transposase and inactivated derivatives, IS5 family
MNRQKSFTDFEYASRRKTTRREEFLKTMDAIIPWQEWVELIRPYYPTGHRGRPPIGIEIMLRMYFLQIWFSLSDELVEDSIYDSYAMRSFLGIEFGENQAPDATTLLKFRHLIEKNDLAKNLFDDLSQRLESHGCIMRGGSIIDATIIQAPSSTKNSNGERDPEMHQTKKGNTYYFGMKAHIGVDAGSGYIHTITATAANAHDVTEGAKLIRKDDEVVYGDSGYTGLEKRPEVRDDEQKSKIDFRTNMRPGKLRRHKGNAGNDWDRFIEQRKSSVRCKVEHAFRLVKVFFGYRKTAYRGIAKNLNRLYMLFASANLLMCAQSGGFREW